MTTDTAALAARYLSTVSNGTSADIAALYAADGRLEDPVGSVARVGRAAIEEFYRGLDAADVVTELIVARAVGLEVAFHFRVTTTLPDATVVVEPIDVMTFDDAGLITSMRAFWTPGDMTLTTATAP